MRMMARVSIPVEAGNRAIKDGSLARVVQATVDKWKPEASYFTTFDGRRTAFFIFDMVDQAQVPSFCEPLFDALDATVQVVPAMNAEDLTKGLSAAG